MTTETSVKQLPDGDAVFLSTETDTAWGHVGGMSILDPTGVPDWSYEKLLRQIDAVGFLRREQLMGDLQRGHDCDSIGAHHLSPGADRLHLPIDILGALQQRVFLLGRAREAILAFENRDA